MIERPIKKSDRQSQNDTETNLENLDSVHSTKPNSTSSKPSDNRSSGKGKKASFGDESKQQVNQGNPALARGPKPVKPKINAKTNSETELENTSEESQD
jgi:hypothetical protein